MTRPLRYSGPLDCFRQGFRAGGLPNLYKGVSAPLVGAAVETGSLFLSYRLAQLAVQRLYYSGDGQARLSVSALAASGALSGGFTSLLLTPIELVKCQMQAPQGIAPNAAAASGARRPLVIIADVYRHYGLQGFWRGQLGTLIRETGGSASWFGCYEGVCAFFKRKRPPVLANNQAPTSVMENAALPIWQQLLAGATAGVTYNFAFYPADTIKSRMQTEEVAPLLGGRRPTFWAIGRALWRQRGLQGLYQGCGITVGRSAPSSAFIFAIYEGLKSSFG